MAGFEKTAVDAGVDAIDGEGVLPVAIPYLRRHADLGKVDILVNNAGISHAKPFDTVTDEDRSEEHTSELQSH